ncbi:M56 family metallopeptidase [Streptomyces sp. CHD11]|nr:M56 family metallopeptidase [Streptomyces sp. CHD11]
MNAAPALLGYAATVAMIVPPVMARARWPHRSPRLAAALWSALAVSFSLCVALAVVHALTPDAHVGVLYSCQVALGISPGEGAVAKWGITALAVVAGAPVGVFAFHALRARGARNRHRTVLDMIGRRTPALRATVIEHPATAAYCLPGRHPRIVVSRGAVERLSDAELGAVVEHERAHIAGRHHLVLAAVHGFATVFGPLPLARHLLRQMPLLLEMAADDRALRRYPHGVLAAALIEIASGQPAPLGALSAAGPTAVVRLQRILRPGPAAHPAARWVTLAVSAALPVLPLALAC